MNIINIEKLNGYKTIVLTGRDNHVRKIAIHLGARVYSAPRDTAYYEDYPMIAEDMKNRFADINGLVIITTQNKEFLDCLLESSMDFAMVTVRKFEYDDSDTYRLRVLTKEDALENRRAFKMELR